MKCGCWAVGGEVNWSKEREKRRPRRTGVLISRAIKASSPSPFRSSVSAATLTWSSSYLASSSVSTPPAVLLLVLGPLREVANRQVQVECPGRWRTALQIHQGLRHVGPHPCLTVVLEKRYLVGLGVVQKVKLLSSGVVGGAFEVYVSVEQRCEVVLGEARCCFRF